MSAASNSLGRFEQRKPAHQPVRRTESDRGLEVSIEKQHNLAANTRSKRMPDSFEMLAKHFDILAFRIPPNGFAVAMMGDPLT